MAQQLAAQWAVRQCHNEFCSPFCPMVFVDQLLSSEKVHWDSVQMPEICIHVNVQKCSHEHDPKDGVLHGNPPHPGQKLGFIGCH